jgi:hypothetical protein
MNKKKWMAWMGTFLILGLGFAFSADSPQKAARNSYKNTVKSEVDKRPLFVDEDGDGICDLARNGKSQGTPNPNKPEWSEKKENKNYQHKNENNASSDQNQRRFNHREENTWNRQSPTQKRENFGNNICDETGPKGRSSRKGNGQK